MSQLVSVPSTHTSKVNDGLVKKDWQQYQNLPKDGRFVEPKIFSGFQHQRIKLISAKKQPSNPKLPSIRRFEREEVLQRLTDEQIHPSNSFIEGQCENLDAKPDESINEFSGINWQNTSKTLVNISDGPLFPQESIMDFGVRLLPDTMQKDFRRSRTHNYRSPSLLSTTPTTLTLKSSRYSSYIPYGSDSYMQSPRLRHSQNKRNPTSLMPSIFRSSRMHMDLSAFPWYSSRHFDGPKSNRF